MNNSNNKLPNDGLQKLINGFLGKNLEISPDNAERIKSLVNSLSQDDIQKITQMVNSGNIQNVLEKITDKK